MKKFISMILAVTMCFGFASCGNENSTEESVPVAPVTEPPANPPAQSATTKSGYTNAMDIIEDAKKDTVAIVSKLGIADESAVSEVINLIKLSNDGKSATLELEYINPTTSDTKIYDASFTLVGTIANQLKLETVHSGESDDVFSILYAGNYEGTAIDLMMVCKENSRMLKLTMSLDIRD